MPIRDVDFDKLEACADVPEKPRKILSMVLSSIGIVLMITDIVGMLYMKNKYGYSEELWPDSIKMPITLLEAGWLISLILFFVSLKFHRKNIPFYVLGILWAIYLVWFVLSMTTNVPFI